MLYALRNVSAELWRMVKARAAREGRTIRGVILLLLQHYVDHGVPGDRRNKT
jgi:hypothetical protein